MEYKRIDRTKQPLDGIIRTRSLRIHRKLIIPVDLVANSVLKGIELIRYSI